MSILYHAGLEKSLSFAFVGRLACISVGVIWVKLPLWLYGFVVPFFNLCGL